jgi:hypothetical protein
MKRKIERREAVKDSEYGQVQRSIPANGDRRRRSRKRAEDILQRTLEMARQKEMGR